MKNKFRYISIIASLVAFVTLFSCQQEKSFNIKGTINPSFEGYVILQKIQKDSIVTIDSVQAVNNTFSFKGAVDIPELYYIRLENIDHPLGIFIENEPISVVFDTANVSNSKISGSKTHDLFVQYKDIEKEYTTQLQDLYRDYKDAINNKKSDEEIMAIENHYDSIERNMFNKAKEFINTNNKSVVSPYLAWTQVYSLSYEELTEMMTNFDTTISKSVFYQKLKDRQEILSKLQIGSQAFNFTLNDINGKPFELNSLKGKYVLLDFWASWCRPCRNENPNVVANYQKYKNQGFTVLGVSLDNNSDDWKKAIKDDKLDWYHVSELKGWETDVAKQYGVMSIPSNFLLDTTGVIIAKDLHGDALGETLEGVFNKK